MAKRIDLDNLWLQSLLQKPQQSHRGNLNGSAFSANLIIPFYRKNIEAHYADVIQGDLAQECRNADMPVPFEHFGVVIHFDDQLEVDLYSSELNLNPGICALIQQVGIVVLQNVHHPAAVRDYGHRNRFPHLQFHIDRSAKQDARYSLYTRDPFDPEQVEPRTSSTLFISNIVGQLQGIKEGSIDRLAGENIITSSPFFTNEFMENVLGKVVLEQRWDQPRGVGEIAMIDNATVLHSSFYRDAQRSGYKIGVRYLAGLNAA